MRKRAGSSPVRRTKFFFNILWQMLKLMNMRIGQGYDIHVLTENRKLIIGGVEIPYEKGLLGHSDADVLIHAIIDSLFGAAALRDIGFHFPDNDEKYKNISSIDLLSKTKEIISKNNFTIVNIDSTIICQKPKLSEYIEPMRDNISKALDININKVNIKAKTNENCDSVGKGDAISAMAIALILGK